MRSTTAVRPAMPWMTEAGRRESEVFEARSGAGALQGRAPRDLELAFSDLMREIEVLQDHARLNLEVIRLAMSGGRAPGPLDRSRKGPRPR